MSAQTRYSFSSQIGVAGGIVDLAPYAIDTFLVEDDTGKMKFGVGVVKGTKKGSEVALPATGKKEGDFEGITVNNRTTEYDTEGKINIRKGASIGVMRYGRIYARVAQDATPEYGDPVYLVINDSSHGEVGYFKDEDGSADTIAISGRFLGTKDPSTGVALIELFNAPAPAEGE